ncbi:MAG: UDP-N-acetylmuramate dehydrogenase [Spirochaetia bacterium]
MFRLKKSDPKINITGELRFHESMAGHTTFKVGGPADVFAIPADEGDIVEILRFAESESIPTFILGGGANILVADAGIRGIVIDMGRFDSITAAPPKDGTTVLSVGAGLPVSRASAWAADHGLGGLEFIYSMPGSVAGAVWMNARCYDAEVYDILSHVDLLSRTGHASRYQPKAEDFAYKHSPFQGTDSIMTSVGFALRPADRQSLWKEMKDHESDRTAKGHFAAPCAGSVFKNNRAFGRPSGAIIDGLGLRGFSIGGAKVSDLHANIIINADNASAADIRAVSDHLAREVKERLGFRLEREILLVGEWEAQ